MTWLWLRQWLPFIAGVAGGGAVITGALLAVQAVREFVIQDDAQYALAIILCAACIGIGGVLVLTNTLEVWK
jgi:hypothetical protein